MVSFDVLISARVVFEIGRDRIVEVDREMLPMKRRNRKNLVEKTGRVSDENGLLYASPCE